MRSIKQLYDFLPEGWYFTTPNHYDRSETVNLHTASDVIVARKTWSYDDLREPGIRVLEGMENETNFIQSLFNRKEAKDQYDREQRDLQWRAECAQREQEELDKVRRDFEKINRSQPEKPSQDTAFFDFEKRLSSFKQKLKLK